MRTMEMNQTCLGELEPPRFEKRGPLLIAGLSGQFACQPQDEIPALWRRFLPQLDRAPGTARQPLYGVCLDCAGFDTFEYLCGVETEDGTDVPQHWARVRIAAHTYAVFPHHGHVSQLRDTVNAIFEEWLPQSGHEVAETAPDEPDFLERYTGVFDPDTGQGGIEIWLPIHAPARGDAQRH